MSKKALSISIVIALFGMVFFLSKAFATQRPWQLATTASSYQAQTNSDASQPANLDASGSWYSLINPNYQPKYYWYNSPHKDGWNNAYSDWWCW